MTPDNIAQKPDYQAELLPCPKCFGEAEVLGDNFIACKDHDCGIQMDWGHWCGPGAKEKLITGWNTRAADAVTRPTQPEVMSEEEFSQKVCKHAHDNNGYTVPMIVINLIKQRDEAIRQSERAKCREEDQDDAGRLHRDKMDYYMKNIELKEMAKGLVEALKRISEQSWGTPEGWYHGYAKSALTNYESGE